MAATLEDMMRYGLGQQTPTTSIGDNENQLLEMLRQYDPNASWKYQDNSGSSNEGGGSAANTYVLDFDQTKLPKAPNWKGEDTMVLNSANQLMNNFQYMGNGKDDDPYKFAADGLRNENLQWDTPYGRMTDSRNVINDPTLMDSVYQWAPMIIMSLATLGAGAPLMSGLSGAFSASGAGALESTLGSLLPGMLDGASRGNFNWGSLAGAAGSLAGLPSWLRPLLSQGTNALINNRKGP